MKKRSLFTILAIILVVGGLILILQNNKKKNQAEVAIVAETNADVAVRTAQAKKEEISGEFTVNGTFLPNKQSQIASEISGQLISLTVKEGSYVRAGQSIGRLGGEKLNVNVGNAKANLAQAQSALSRYEAAFKTGGITALQLDEARLQVRNARSQVQSTQLQSGDTNIISKISGIVNQKMVEVGAILSPGTPIIEIVDISSVKLKVDVDQALVSQLTVGNTVKIKPDVVDGTVDGRITFIAPSASGALKFPVEITIPNSFNKIRAGMYGSAMFNKEGANNVLVVPRDAFVGSVSDNLIFVVKNNVAYLTKVQSGINYGDKVEIISGLTDGDVVVTSGQINLSDKTKIRILK